MQCAEVEALRQARREGVSGGPLDVIIDELYRNNVGYIVEEVWDRKAKKSAKRRLGTTFFLSLPAGPDASVPYAVTAAHVLATDDADPASRRLFYRVNNKKGRSEDVPFKYKEWIFHPSTDVAACEPQFPSRITFNPIAFGPPAAQSE